MTRHIIIAEHEHLRNRKYVEDNKWNFNSGILEKISLEKLGEVLEKLFATLDRPVFVGHSIDGDLKRLASICVYIDKHDIVDIALARQGWEGKLESVSLAKMLDDLEIE